MSDKKVYGHTGRFVALRLAAGPSDLIDWLERDFDEMVESRDHWKQLAAEQVRRRRLQREALQMLWDHYLLTISNEQKNQVIAALGVDA